VRNKTWWKLSWNWLPREPLFRCRSHDRQDWCWSWIRRHP
jgi:hypothetical protein